MLSSHTNIPRQAATPRWGKEALTPQGATCSTQVRAAYLMNTEPSPRIRTCGGYSQG